MTATREPTCSSARRKPCMAIAPRVAKDASSNETPSGMGAQRRPGTMSISAWLAAPPPAMATRSPGLMPVTPAPTSIAVPAAL